MFTEKHRESVALSWLQTLWTACSFCTAICARNTHLHFQWHLQYDAIRYNDITVITWRVPIYSLRCAIIVVPTLFILLPRKWVRDQWLGIGTGNRVGMWMN